jgi:hypothetical protein
MRFEISNEFLHFSSNSGVGDFCSCKVSMQGYASVSWIPFSGGVQKASLSALPRADIVGPTAFVRFVPPIGGIATSGIIGKGLVYSHPSPSDRTLRRDWNEASRRKFLHLALDVAALPAVSSITRAQAY